MVLKVLRSKKFAKVVFAAILILIIPAFVFWGVGTFARRPTLIGYIGKEKIHQDAFERSRQGVKIQLLLIYYANYEALSQILKNQAMVNYMAWERLILLSEATKRKINISNNDVLGILSRHPLFQRNGIFSKEMYNYILRNTMYMEARQFEELVRENLKTHIIRQEILKDINVSEDEIKDIYEKLNEKNKSSFDSQKEPLRRKLLASKQVAAIENWFKENKENVKLLKPLDEL